MRIKLPPPRTSTSSSSLSSSKPFPHPVNQHLNTLALRLSHPPLPLPLPATYHQYRTFSHTLPFLHPTNRIHPSVRRPSDFHLLLQSSSSSNTLLLALFRTSTSGTSITSVIESVVRDRASPSPGDAFTGGIAFTELELDSPERDDGGGSGWSAMYDIGVEYGVSSVPTLIGFGGRRAERITERVADEAKLGDRRWLEEWLDEVMRKGDPSSSAGGGGGGGLWARLFGGGGGG